MDKYFQTRYEQLLKQFRTVGVTVGIATPKEIVEIFSLGEASVENNEITMPDTIYRIASISKVIVALGAMFLVEEGKLDIDADISDYLGYRVRNPYYPECQITPEMLMTQTSSIHDGEDLEKGYDGVNGPTMEVLLEDLLTNPASSYYTEKTFLNQVPGTYWNYSNFGCGILACIIEKITGKYFTDYIREKLLIPLDIDGSFCPNDIEHPEKIASLYEYQDGAFMLSRNKAQFLQRKFPRYPLGNNFRGPAGGLFISGLDLIKIMQMMMNQGTYQSVSLLKPETIQCMEAVHWQGISGEALYRAKGLQLLLLDGWTEESLKGHFGSAYGLRSFMLYTRNVGYLFLCNGANFEMDAIGMTTLQKETLQSLIEWSKEMKLL